MSRKVFEYFFDPEDLEPFYSELGGSFTAGKADREVPSPRPQKPVADVAKPQSATAPARPILLPASTIVQREQRAPQDEQTSRPEEQLTRKVPSEEAANAPETVTATIAPAAQNEAATPVTAADESRRTRVRHLISVHALGQYVFCLRSAILSTEKGDQRDIDEGLPRFTYLPNFDREKIEEMLSAKMTQLGFFVLYGVCLAVLMRMGIAEQNRWVFYPSFLALVGLGLWSLNVFVCIIDLAIRRRAAIRAEAREPEPNITTIQRVNWWSMLKAGFEPISHERSFQHPELPLEGSPWRVLQRGSLRIPVVKSGSPKLGERKNELFPKHQVRLVAYALLLEAAGHIEVPYGLVFPVDSPRGLAFPITRELRDRTVRLLYEFEQKLAESQRAKIQPQLPENRNRCVRCEYGRPVPTTTRAVENARKAGQQLVVLQHRSGDIYRCECADRFGSAPPHGLTLRKGLTSVVS